MNFNKIGRGIYIFMIYLLSVSLAFSISATTVILGFILLLYLLNFKDSFKKSPKDFLLILVFYTWRAFTLSIYSGYIKAILKFFNGIWDFLAYPLIASGKINERVVKNVISIAIWINVAIFIYAILQKLFGFPIIYKDLFWGDYRYSGFYSNPIRFAGYYSSVLILSFIFGLFINRVYLFAFTILTLGLLLTGARTYWISVFVVLLAVSFVKSKKTVAYLLFSIASIIVVYFIFFKEYLMERLIFIEQHIEFRLNFWKAGIEIFLSNPLFGVGYGEVGRYLQPYFAKGLIDNTAHCHNTYITVLAENGIIGFILLIVFFVYFIKKYWKYYKTEKDRLLKALALGLFAIFMNLIMASFTEHILKNFTLWTFAGLLMGLFEAYKAGEPSPQGLQTSL
ncbi:MAG: O-antigen ligase family protein [Aquificaceae bacterium]